ncbi:MAG: helix-turn-helix domain-containing protein [Candidatus Tenebribacter davisii]|nr:helix-turn-helix domain-containing protein [Candidatus Tenebribacter davisii]
MKTPLVKKELERPFMSLSEAVDYTQFKRSTLYSFCHFRILNFFKVRGRKIFFLKADLDEFILNEDNLVKSVQQIEKEVALHVLKKDKRGGK